ncbi:Hypothetical predicted protein [Cloeon dipterum]|uniref:TIR domain-containing protein n=1 Tax=Cloeon dipterum TaxID=197152 RepID=A0A8S1DWT4_9INSE|nr:Hypothetical predicted protein [Cloeon dipterum]
MGPKKKKKLTKEEKAKLRAEELERIRREEELERERLEQEAAEAHEAARVKAEDDAKREVQEQIWRVEQLEHTKTLVSACLAKVTEAECRERHEKQWEQYMKCDGLPDPASPPAMHTYLHLWRSEPKARRNIEPVVEKTAEVLQLLNDLDELIETEDGGRLLPLWWEVRQKVRLEQQVRIDEATYGLLRAASTMLASVDSTVVRYHREADPYLSLTLQTDLAAPAPDATAPSWDFEEVGVSMQLPSQFAGLHAAARALWLRYDHYTDLCPSRIPPPAPEHHSQDMVSIAIELWQRRLEEKEREAEEQATLAAAEEQRLAAEETKKGIASSAVPDVPPGEETVPVLEDAALEGQELQEGAEVEEADTENEEEREEPPPRDEEAERQKAEMEAMIKDTRPHELNLRKMTVLGGVLHLDLLEQPPQPREFNKNLSLTVYMRNNIAAVIAYLLIITVKSDVDVPSCKVLDVQPLQMPFTGDGLIMVERMVSQPTMLCPEDEITVDTYGCTYCNRTETMACQGASVTALPEPKDLPDIKFSLRVLGSWITYIKKQAFYGKHIKELHIENNEFIVFHLEAFYGLSDTEYLSLANNKLIKIPTQLFHPLKDLTTLVLDDNGIVFPEVSPNTSILDKEYEYLTKLEYLLLQNNDLNHLPQDAFEWLKNSKLRYMSLRGSKITYAHPDALKPLFENLKGLEMADSSCMGETLANITAGLVNGTESKLEYLGLSSTGLIRIPQKALSNAVPNLRILDLSNNENIIFEPNAFKGLGKLEKLRLINCNIEFKPDLDVDFFIHMPNIIDLHLSHNKISTIPKNTFQSLPELQSIRLDHNLLDSWTTKIFENNTKLVHIDVDNNQICHFANETAEELLKTEHISFEYNPLLCDCSLYNFVQALVQSDVKVSHWLEEDNSYSCYDTENERSLLIAHYLPNCVVSENKIPTIDPDSNPTIVAIISGSTIVIICLIVVSFTTVVYKKRSKLRYFGIMVKNALSVALMDDDNEESQEDAIFIYDVFVSYCDADREWVIKKLLPELEQENNLRVCLHERDFQPGYGILDNIVHCIDKSRSLIIVVSKKSLKSQWCHFEMHLAQHRFIETRKEQLILVLMEELPRNQRPRTLHYLMATRTFLLWNEKQISEPLSLQKVHYYVKYVPPPPPEPGKKRLPEEIEAEIKLQELEFEKIAQVHISLPSSVLWFEPPIVVGWDDKNEYWSTEDLHDLKFNEEKQILSFRAGRIGSLALAAFRYTNLPYQTWELKPTTNGILFSITAAVVVVEFIFKDGLVSLSQLQNGTTNALQDQVGKFYKPKKLIKIMRLGGVDIFPPHDAHCYMSAVSPKQRTTERHLYQCMAYAAKSHCFAWSRWNLLAGHSRIVLQMKEINIEDATKSQAEFDMLLVTSQRSSVVHCTEVSQSFSDEPAQGMNFYADVYHLLLNHGSEKAKSFLREPDVPLVHCVFDFLDATKVLSFS